MNGWIVLKTDNIVYAQLSGEKMSEGMETANDWVRNVCPKLISGYKEDDIFNADETATNYYFQHHETLCHIKNKIPVC